MVHQRERVSVRRPRKLLPVVCRGQLDLLYDCAVFQVLQHNLRLCTGALSFGPAVRDQFTIRRNSRGKRGSVVQFNRRAAIDGDLENAGSTFRLTVIVNDPLSVGGARTIFYVLAKSKLLQLTRAHIQPPDIGGIVLKNSTDHDRIPGTARICRKNKIIIFQQADPVATIGGSRVKVERYISLEEPTGGGP